jgi:hypothetical protein
MTRREYRQGPETAGPPVRVGLEPATPGLAGGAALGRGEKVLERDVEEGALRLREELLAVPELPGDLDPTPAVRGDVRRDS